MSAPIVGERTCRCGCGWSITHKSPQARFFDGTHSKRYEREVRHEDRTPQKVTDLCTCGSAVTYADPEHELVCVFCAKPTTARKAAVNGYDDGLAEAVSLMEHQGLEHYRGHRSKRGGRR